IAIGTLILTVILYVLTPKGFFPPQDTGLIQGITEAPQSVSFAAMAQRQEALARVLLQDPAVESVSSFIGVDGVNTTLNSGRLLINMVPKSARSLDAAGVIRRLQPPLAGVDGITVYMQPVQDLTIDARVSRTLYALSAEDPDMNGNEIQLASVARIREGTAPLAINHLGQFPAATVSFNLAPGASLGEAVSAIKAAQQQLQIPASVQMSFQGAALAFQGTLGSTLWLILAAIVTVYIVLGVLYESYIHPVTILSTLPSAGVGALLALMIAGQDLSVVAIIGIILLIGIVKKNAIMMIDFALQAERLEGKPPRAAIYQAALLRLRPILMTTLAAMLGALPLMLAGGMGSELRRPLGIAMVGGLAMSQV